MSLPEQLGRLRRIDRIGAGGFATVWLYYDDELRSPVAVKALAENWAQRDDIRNRFLEEARILRRADSDHVVRVYDIGEVDGTPYFVMSYCDRGSLADHLAIGHPLPPPMAVDLISQAALGLDVLHRHGVIHRDIKPQNLLLKAAPDGHAQVLVADLGVAKAMLQASGVTQVVGTPAYMAPEQATGAGVDQRADVHALGAVAYQMFTGRRVREGMEAVAKGEPPVPPSHYAPLSGGVDAIVLRALEADPNRRWPGVLDFARALQAEVLGPGGRLPGYSASSASEPTQFITPQPVSSQPSGPSNPPTNPPAQQPTYQPYQQPPATRNVPSPGPGTAPTPGPHVSGQSARPEQADRQRPIGVIKVLLIGLLVAAIAFGAAFLLVRLFTH